MVFLVTDLTNSNVVAGNFGLQEVTRSLDMDKRNNQEQKTTALCNKMILMTPRHHATKQF